MVATRAPSIDTDTRATRKHVLTSTPMCNGASATVGADGEPPHAPTTTSNPANQITFFISLILRWLVSAHPMPYDSPLQPLYDNRENASTTNCSTTTGHMTARVKGANL